MAVKKVNETFYVKVDSNRDAYGATGFSGKVVNDVNGTSFDIVAPFEEIVLPHESHSATTTAIVPVGAKVFTVSLNTFVAGDVFEYLGEMYYIKEVNGNVISLYERIRSEIPISSVLSQVGNTGIYRVEVTIPSIGNYTILILNDSLSIQNREVSVKIIDEDITDAHTKLDSILTKVDTISAERNYVGFV